ncbi:MAG: hypothetical protein DWP95_10320 [Proteobacteria bacterium]|nr:MAG: hypothetical protein DWP95_10320 [Pseudomonadota bacterium]
MIRRTFIIETVNDHRQAVNAVDECYKLASIEQSPHLLEIKPFEGDRSLAQNRLQFHWFNQLERQSFSLEPGKAAESIGGWTIDMIRAYCKFEFGVPIMSEDSEFIYTWSLAMRGIHEREDKLLIAKEWPVTSLMNTEQFTRYLNNIYYHFTPQGAILTTNSDLYYEAMGLRRER